MPFNLKVLTPHNLLMLMCEGHGEFCAAYNQTNFVWMSSVCYTLPWIRCNVIHWLTSLYVNANCIEFGNTRRPSWNFSWKSSRSAHLTCWSNNDWWSSSSRMMCWMSITCVNSSLGNLIFWRLSLIWSSISMIEAQFKLNYPTSLCPAPGQE